MSVLEKDRKKTHTLHKTCMHEGEKQNPCLGVSEQGGRSRWLWLHQTGCNCEVDVRRQTEMHVWLQARLEGGRERWGGGSRDSQNRLFVPRPTCGYPSLSQPHPHPSCLESSSERIHGPETGLFFFSFHLQKGSDQSGGYRSINSG